MLFVGGLDQAHYFKGVDVLLEALRRLSDQAVRLAIIGDGDLRPAYEQRARDLGLGSRVIFCGRVSNADLPAWYAKAYAF